MSAFAKTPKPPYYAVIFTNTRTEGDNGYGETAERMVELAKLQGGFLGIDSVRDSDLGITVSYWRDEQSIAAWKAQMEHAQARSDGRAKWYAGYTLRVAKVERAYDFGDLD